MCLKVFTICILPERVISKNNPDMWKWLNGCSDLLMKCYYWRLGKDGMNQLECQKMNYMFPKIEWQLLVLTTLQFFSIACPSSTSILLGTQKRKLFPYKAKLTLVPLTDSLILYRMSWSSLPHGILEMKCHLPVFFFSQL